MALAFFGSWLALLAVGSLMNRALHKNMRQDESCLALPIIQLHGQFCNQFAL